MSNPIPNIGNELSQKLTVIRDNGSEFDLYVSFKPQAAGWFMSIESEGRTINNIRIVTSGNCLHQFRNLLGFGISCTTDDGYEPQFIDDFSSGRAVLNLLSPSDVDAYSELVSG